MFFEISALQSFSTVNLNRDDTNSIKTINFGGYNRQRVSSQCWKRAIRTNENFYSEFKDDLGIRTRNILTEICRMAGIAPDNEKFSKNIVEFLDKIGMGESESVKKKSKGKSKNSIIEVEENNNQEPQRLKTLFFTSRAEIEMATRILKKHEFDSSKASSEFSKERELSTLAPDIALFGRMTASSPKLKVDGAVQFAHAISTNKIFIEDDFFTALDDLTRKEEGDDPGAGMLGTVQLASPCFYRYACVSWETLLSNLKGDKEAALKTLNAFFKSFVLSIPTGQSNTTAPNSLPDFVLLSATKKQPMSLVNSFLKPIDVGDNPKLSLMESSVSSLIKYLAKNNQMYNWGDERKSLCIHQLNKEMEIDEKLKTMNINTTPSNLDKSLEHFIKEIAWS